ncbi:MAG TPA: hypothetical protein VFW60_00345 [Rhodanobacteraceae bacterium]|nr:hypothetical protein [Rhodanobacteraceae bacterium]
MPYARFRLKQVDTLPCLAWCACITRGESDVHIYHGNSVECALDARSFHEGAWSGSHGDGNFDEALTFTGSGGRVTEDGVVFASSTHTLEPVYLVRLQNTILCSNSMHFILSEASDWLDVNYPYYEADIMTIMFGLTRYKSSIPTRTGNTLRSYYRCNIVISDDLVVTRHSKRSPPPFVTFQDYCAFLHSEVQQVAENAAAPQRRRRYKPLTTISSGYDSPAAAVVARAAGCTEAITLTRAHPGLADRNDSGSQIAMQLGLKVTEVDYFAGRNAVPEFPEAEFMATGHGGDDMPLAVAEAELAGTLLCTGFHGDKVWDKNDKQPSRSIVRGGISGCSLAEFRLRAGFLNLPVPFIGCIRHPEIHRISNAPDMAPWSIGGKYDRPVPRRIVEQAGVPRALFGQAKKGVATPYQSDTGRNPPMDRVLCKASYLDFIAFAQTFKRYSRRTYRMHYDIMHGLYILNQRVVWSGKLKRALGRVGLSGPSRVWVPWRFAKPWSTNFLAFYWAATKMRQRYERSVR